MVCRGSPDPPRESYEESFSMGDAGNNIVINASSDSEDEGQVYDGYELLSTISNDVPDSDSDQSDEEANPPNVPEATASAPGGNLNLAMAPVEASETARVWAAPRAAAEQPGAAGGIAMGTEQVDQVKAVMAGIKLPPSSIPSWAAAVPEDQWRATLMDRLKTLQTSTSGSSSNQK